MFLLNAKKNLNSNVLFFKNTCFPKIKYKYYYAKF